MDNKNKLITNALAFFDEGYSCTQSVLLTFADQFGIDQHSAKLISSTFGGGMGLREKCGAITGGFMVLGLKHGNTNPKDKEAKQATYQWVRELNKIIEETHDSTLCSTLQKKYENEIDGPRSGCRKIVRDVVAATFDMLEQNTHPQ